MRSRIEKFIEAERLTAAEFADKIGVQRSSVSHVLNGRNNPGFSFIQKILEAYPSINSRWLLTGQGSMYDKKEIIAEKKEGKLDLDLFSTMETKQETAPEPSVKKQTEEALKQETQEIPSIRAEEKKNTEQTAQTRTVSKVLIFYTDHTFEEYRPAE